MWTEGRRVRTLKGNKVMYVPLSSREREHCAVRTSEVRQEMMN